MTCERDFRLIKNCANFEIFWISSHVSLVSLNFTGAKPKNNQTATGIMIGTATKSVTEWTVKHIPIEALSSPRVLENDLSDLPNTFVFAFVWFFMVQTHSIPAGFENESFQVSVIKQVNFAFGFLVVESNKRGLVGYLGSIQVDRVQKRIPVLYQSVLYVIEARPTVFSTTLMVHLHPVPLSHCSMLYSLYLTLCF